MLRGDALTVRSIWKFAEGRNVMTQLELIVEIGCEGMTIVKMYCEGIITQKELHNVLGEQKGRLVHRYLEETGT